MVSRVRSSESATMPTWALSQRKIRRISFASRERRYESWADCSRDRGRLDVDRLVAGTAALNRALHLAPMVLGHGQDVVMADHREVGVAEDPLDLGRSQHPAERFLDLFLGLADLASQHRQPAAGGVQHLGPAVEAALDGGGHAGELPDALAQAAQPGKLVADPRQPAVEVARSP